MSKQFIKLKEVIKKTALSRSTIYLMMNKGDFPNQYQISARSVVWIEEEVDQWIDNKIILRNAANSSSFIKK